MKIMVFDVPAEYGGALTILKKYYNDAILDKNNQWIFVVSTPVLEECSNIKVINYKWIKKSWFHRLFFDKFIAKKVVNSNRPDKIISLQNVLIDGIDINQDLYLHQPLPFVEKKYKLHQNPKFWVYQNIISKKIFKSIKKANKVIFQTNWIKDKCIEMNLIVEEKCEVKQPNIEINVKKQFSNSNHDGKVFFFYPASAIEYKNHIVILKACRELVLNHIIDFKVIFTIEKNENRYAKSLYKYVLENNLPIEFVGNLKQEKVYEYYSNSILIFPSYIETFGLPMLEARMHKTPILVAESNFSEEVLNGYNKVEKFKVNDFEKLKVLMKSNILKKYNRSE